MLVMQLFFPTSCQKPSTLSLQPDDRLRIDGHPNTIEPAKLKRLLKHLRRMGAWTLPSFIVRVPTGHAVHYAGTIPMAQRPESYQCDERGKLQNTENIYIGDSASFPFLSAKNMSFAMMANAMRVAGHVAGDITVRR
jgi:choline dehydrogenase-like flavoprotein